MLSTPLILKRSFIAFGIFSLLYLGAGMNLVLYLDRSFSIVLVPVILFAYYRTLIFHVFRIHPRAMAKIAWDEQSGQWQSWDNKGNHCFLQIKDNSIMSNFFVLLNFKKRGRCNSVIIFIDALEENNFIDLKRLLLRYKRLRNE